MKIAEPAFLRDRDKRWLAIWLTGILVLTLWDLAFLNRPAFKQVAAGFANTLLIAAMVIVFSLLLGWAFTICLEYLQKGKGHSLYLLLTFLMNLVRSVPQIVGILIGYVIVSVTVESGAISGKGIVFLLLSWIMSVFIFGELVDLMRERIAHYRKLDFWNAMLVCGISKFRVINFDILWKNSRVHIKIPAGCLLIGIGHL